MSPKKIIYISQSVSQFNPSFVSDSLRPHGLQHIIPPCPSPTTRACSNSCSLSQWCHPTISSSVSPSLPIFNLSQHQGLFKWVSSLHQVAKSIGASASASFPPKNTQGWSPLEWTGWSPCSPRDSQESSPTPHFKSINSSALSLLHSPALTSIHDH